MPATAGFLVMHVMLHEIFVSVVPKFQASYINKHNTTAMTSLFLYIIPVNFNALILSFLQLLYFSFVEEFILSLRKVLHRFNDVIFT